MKRREIARIKRRAAHGSFELRLTEVFTALDRVQKDLGQMRTELRERCLQYWHERKSWGIEVQAFAVPPTPLAAQLRQANLCFTGALSAAVIEVLITGFFAQRNSVSPWLPMLLALLLPLVLKTALATFLYDEERPSETLRRLRLYVLGPSLALFTLAVILLFTARIAGPALPLLLLPLLNLAPLALGIGCLGAASSLFAQWHLLAWSNAAVRAYRQLEAEEMNTSELERHLLLQQQKLRAQYEKLRIQQQMQRLAAPALLLLVLTQGGCETRLQSMNAPPASIAPAATPAAGPGGSLLVINDGSISVNPETRQVAAHNLLRRLPELVEANRVTSFEAIAFAQRGWDCEPFITLLLPQKPGPISVAPSTAGSEFELFGGGLNLAISRHAEDDAQEQYQSATQHYRAEVRADLAVVTADRLLNAAPCGSHDRTDLNGVLARVAQLPNDGRRRLVFLITDGVDTRTGRLEAIAHPAADIRLLVILTSSLTGRRADQEYKLRSALLLKACPWAIVMPYFKDDYQQTLDQVAQSAAIQTGASTPPLIARLP